MANQIYMYKCEICKQVIPPHTKAIRVPIATRTKQYPSQQKEVSYRGKRKTINVPGGVGYEIVSEAVACPACAAKFEGQPEEISAAA